MKDEQKKCWMKIITLPLDKSKRRQKQESSVIKRDRHGLFSWDQASYKSVRIKKYKQNPMK